MRVGFTGTREGLQPGQAAALIMLLRDLGPFLEFHHGDCVGADADAVAIVRSFGWPDLKVHCHPPDVATLRANTEADVTYATRPYLWRNNDIVRSCDVLVACPKEAEEVPQGGTWYTVRQARQRGVGCVYIVWPNGFVSAARRAQ